MDLSSQPLWVYLAAIGVVLAACAGYFAYRRASARHQAALRLAEESARAEAQRAAAEESAIRRVAEHAAQARQAAQLEAARVAEEEAEEEARAAAQAQAHAAARQAEETAAAEKALRDAAERAQRAARDEAARIEAARAEAAQIEAARIEAARLFAEEAAARAAEPVAAKSPEQTLVMIADDSKVVRVKTGRLLAHHHYQVVYAVDGQDAALQMQNRLPDIVITDVEMPGMDGFELTRHVRQNPLTAHIPVIMITAADDKHRSDADRAGVSVLLGKPYPEDELIAYIQKAMGAGKQTAGVAI